MFFEVQGRFLRGTHRRARWGGAAAETERMSHQENEISLKMCVEAVQRLPGSTSSIYKHKLQKAEFKFRTWAAQNRLYTPHITTWMIC